MTSRSNYIKTALRIPQHLHEQLLEAAARNGRSLNAEMIERLSVSQTELSLLELARQTTEIRAMTKEILETVSTDK